MSNQEYFEKEVPLKLEQLQNDTMPVWGTMNVEQMLEHLRRGVVLSMENINDEITTPEDQIPLYKRFLMSDKSFGQNLPQPAAFDRVTPLQGNFEQKKWQLQEALQQMKQFFDKNPGHTAVHQSFGRLNVEEWWQLHRKHFTHHFNQFGLIN